MSKAFTKEDSDEGGLALPDREISPHRNLVTAEGLALIEGTVEALEQTLAEARSAEDLDRVASVARDLRYWSSRRATAEVTEAPENSGEVQFGSLVTIKRADGREQVWRIVGEDEADPKKGTLSYVSPLAQALMGKAAGDEIEVAGGAAEITRIC